MSGLIRAIDPAGSLDDHARSSLTRDLSHAAKTSTVNDYAPYFLQWQHYCLAKGLQDIPADPFALACYLSVSSDGDASAHPTKKRLCSINFFHDCANQPKPGSDPFVQQIYKGIRKRLGSPGAPKDPLTLAQIQTARDCAVSQNESGLVFIADICSIMQEATTRWDDIADLRLGDMIWSTEVVRLLIVDSKTDNLRHGQYATIAVSTDPDSAYQKLCQLILQGIQGFASLPGTTKQRLLAELQAQHTTLPFPTPETSEIGTAPDHILSAAAACGLPLENLPLLGSWPWTTSQKSLLSTLSYKAFLSHVKKLFCHLPNIATHSLRRGGATEKLGAGIEARLVQWIGRWKSVEAFEGYIDSRVNIAAASRAMTQARETASRSRNSNDALRGS